MNMSKLDCHVTEDLLPMYVEELVSEETRMQVDEHLSECKNCRENMLRMSRELNLPAQVPKISKKFLVYLKSVRWWYFLCPGFGMIALSTGSEEVIKYYLLFITLISALFLSSYFAGISYGIDYDQVRLQRKAKCREVKKWGIFRVSPLSLALPAVFTLIIFIIADLAFGLFSFNILQMIAHLL
jgi:hypothetical protein